MRQQAQTRKGRRKSRPAYARNSLVPHEPSPLQRKQEELSSNDMRLLCSGDAPASALSSPEYARGSIGTCVPQTSTSRSASLALGVDCPGRMNSRSPCNQKIRSKDIFNIVTVAPLLSAGLHAQPREATTCGCRNRRTRSSVETCSHHDWPSLRRCPIRSLLPSGSVRSTCLAHGWSTTFAPNSAAT